MEVTLEAINFSHDSKPATAATTDGFRIRKNETQTLTIPEWQRNSGILRGSPAAYARDSIGSNKVTIEARFSCTNKTVPKIWVQALDGHKYHSSASSPLTDVLGRVSVTEVLLSNGRSDWVQMILEDVGISSAGVSVSDIIWCWQFSVDAKHWTDFATTTHRIYTVLDLPTEPWQPKSSELTNVQIPWTDVLELACRWAAGAHGTDDAASKITKEVNDLGFGKVTYFQKPLYIQEGTENFCCTAFLDLIGGGPGKGNTMNCSDCATVVSTFANILGTSLAQSKMGYEFYINHVLRIGQRDDDGGSFHMHEVAWKGNCTRDDPLFDACLHLDGDVDPAKDPFVPLLPINIPFLDPTGGYHFRLKSKDIPNPPCEPDPGSKRHRIIGTSQLRIRQTSPKQLRALLDFYHYTSWQKVRLSKEHIFVWRSFFSGAEAPGWELQQVQSFHTIGDMPPTNESLWKSHDESGTLLRINTFECDSLGAAHSFLLSLLGECDIAYMKREAANERMAFGDVAFTDLEGTSILFARGNMVVTARNAGTVAANLGEFLHRFDVGLKSRPNANEKIESMERFRFSEGKFYVGDNVPLKFLGEFDDQVQYKFFGESGEVFLKGQQLVYQPQVAGLQEVNAFGIDSEQKAKKQTLSVVIEVAEGTQASKQYS